MLHILYKEGINGLEHCRKVTLLIAKKKIQNSLWKNVGIKVDNVIQGKCTSNTGNVARRFSYNYLEISKRTKLDKRLLKIYSTLACSYDVDNEKLDKYAQETTKLNISLYTWLRMPPGS